MLIKYDYGIFGVDPHMEIAYDEFIKASEFGKERRSFCTAVKVFEAANEVAMPFDNGLYERILEEIASGETVVFVSYESLGKSHILIQLFDDSKKETRNLNAPAACAYAKRRGIPASSTIAARPQTRRLMRSPQA